MVVSNNPFTVKGRMHRIAYICTIIILFLIALILNAFLWDVYDRLMAGTTQVFDIIAGIVIIALDIWMIEIYFAVTVKRLRDIRANGWWSLLNFIPIVDVILFIVLAVFPSRHHEDDIKRATQQYAVNQQQPPVTPVQPLVQPNSTQQPTSYPTNQPGNQNH